MRASPRFRPRSPRRSSRKASSRRSSRRSSSELGAAQDAVDDAQSRLGALEAELAAAARSPRAARRRSSRSRRAGSSGSRPSTSEQSRILESRVQSHLHRGAARRAVLPRLGVELRRSHRQLRVPEPDRRPGSSASHGRSSRRNGERLRSGAQRPAQGDSQAATVSVDLGSHGRGTHRARPTRGEPRHALRGPRAQAERRRQFTRDARGVPRRGRRARGAERGSRGGDPRLAGRSRLDRHRSALGGGAHLACGRRRRERLRHALGAHARGDRHRASSGTPIRAAAAGTVIYSGWLGGYGNLVVIDHGNGLSTAYAHASSILVGVGQQVTQGETVSLVGSTGNSSGPHLHFEVRVNGPPSIRCLYL